MGLMDEAIKDTVKDKKNDFKKTDLKRLATRNKQIGGNHYKNLSIQPVDYIVENNLTYLEGNIIKYITRHRRKGDGKKDIEKVIHYAEMILEMEYGE
tara:strand:- start:206 stop:496 length:291 start_codon:yes stop_codon:yes gene_type:complete